MLIIQNYIAQSTIEHAGIGCFSGEKVLKGSLVFKYDPDIDIVVKEEHYKTFSEEKRKFFDEYATLERDTQGDLIRMLSADNTRHINHSSTPNLICIDAYTILAKSTIAQDDELTLDYRTIDENLRDYEGALEEYFRGIKEK